MATTKGRLALSFVTAALAAGSLFAALPQGEEHDRVKRATDRLMSQRTQLGLNADHSYVFKSSHTDNLNMTHAYFNQHYKGVRVFGGDVITHQGRDGRDLPHTNALLPNISLNVTPAIEPAEALAIAHADIAPKGAYAYKPTSELIVYPVTTLVARPGRERVRNPNADDMTTQVVRYHLAYLVKTNLQNGDGETKSLCHVIDAHTGGILKTWDNLHTTGAVGSGKSQYSGTVSINTNLNGSNYELSDVANNMPYKTYNMNHGTGSGTGTLYSQASSNTWGNGSNYTGSTTSTTSATGQTAAVDAHYGIYSTSVFFKNVLGRNGIDNNNKATYNRVHYDTSYDNAFWDDTCFCMTYGDGSSFSSLESLDVAGHEMSHGVCANNGLGGLTYSGESGGLNEANSDILGTFVTFYTYGAGGTGSTVPNTIASANLHGYTPWTIGSQLSSTPLRYMNKPSLDGNSADYWSSSVGSLDVHYSSGPANHMIYFLSQGATTSGNTSSTYLPSGMTGIGNDHAARIWYRALTTYFNSSLTYAQCRTACMNAASDLYGTSSAEYAAVQNAFHGINVGAAAPQTTLAVTNPSSVSVAAGSAASFSVTASGGTAPYSYQWYRGSAAISGATSATYTFTVASSDNGATFKCTVTDNASTPASITSSAATLTVSAPAALAISSQPASATVNSGATASFSVAATGGTAPYKYQWYRGSTAISGATSATYTFTTSSSDNGATFKCTVTDSASTPASVTSSTATLTVSAPAALAISSQPASITVNSGAAASFSVAATGGTAPYKYQWYRGSTAISGATSATYTFTTASTDNGSTFKCTVTDSATSPASVTSNSATLTVNSSSGTELIANGGFESGSTSWSGTTAGIGGWAQEPAHSGTKCAWMMGNGSTSTETLYQAVSIPSTATSATLRFWLHIDTAETTSTIAYDTLTVYITTPAGVILATPAVYSNLNKNTGYTQKSFDISAFKGQTVLVYFYGSEDANAQTSFVIDDVSVKVQ